MMGVQYYTKNNLEYKYKKKLSLLKIPALILLCCIFGGLSFATREQSGQDPLIPTTSQVMGASTFNESPFYPTSVPVQVVNTPTPIQVIVPTETPTPKPKKKIYTIAVIGDSMVDTMGEVCEYLEHSLKKKYPDTVFSLYNYGIGSQNVEDGLKRIDAEFDYKDRHYPALTELKPDIIIVGSFAYNPFAPYDRDRHWIGLTRLVQAAQKISPSVYMLAEIAPLRKNFGKGPHGVNWSTATNITHTNHIIEELQNAIGLSKTLNVPLIDAYTPSIDASTNTVKPEYVNTGDGIHPSVSGHEFMADTITNTLAL